MKKHLIIFFFILTHNLLLAQKSNCSANDLIERLEYTKAIELLTQCIDVTSKNTEGMLQLANCYYYTSKTEEAEKYYNEDLSSQKISHQLAKLQLFNKNQQ